LQNLNLETRSFRHRGRDMKPSRPRRAKIGHETSLETVTKSRDSITAGHTLKLRDEHIKVR